MKQGGAHVWYFPDGYLPEKVENTRLEPHEALMVLNTGGEPARLELDFYFEDRDPVKGVVLAVGAERSVCFRLDHPEQIGGLVIPPLTQYGMRLRSSVPVVAQFARLDATQPNLAYYVNIGYAEEQCNPGHTVIEL